MDEVYYHICGYPIIFETQPAGDGASAVFRDGEQTAGVEADIIEVCPNCGELLLLGDLTPEPADEWW
jgi:hypothetical protein